MCLAVPGQILTLTDESPLTRTGTVDFGGVHKAVNLAFVPEAVAGDYVLVHVGIAIGRIDAAEAARVFGYLEEIGEIDLAASDTAEQGGPGSGPAPAGSRRRGSRA